MTLTHITAVGAAGDSGTGIHNVNSDIVLANNISTSQTVDLDNLNGSFNQDFNLFYGNGIDTQGVVSGGIHNVTGDPNFMNPMQDNNHLGAHSAAIDAGTDGMLTIDYDGDSRSFENGFDMGFDEANLIILGLTQKVYLPHVMR